MPAEKAQKKERFPEVGNRLKEFLEYTGMTQAVFAEMLGTHRTHIQVWLNGSLPGGDYLRKMSFLGLNTNWLLTGQGSMIEKEGQRVNEYDEVLKNYGIGSIKELRRCIEDAMHATEVKEGYKAALKQTESMVKEALSKYKKKD